MKKREEIAEKYKWDLSDHCPNDLTCIKKLNLLKIKMQKIKTFEGKLKEANDDIILECLNFETEISQELVQLSLYASMRTHENLDDSATLELEQLADSIETEFSNISDFSFVEISELSVDYLESLIKNPKFEIYRNYFKQIIRSKPHVLSKKEELLLSKMNEFFGAPEETYKLLINTEIKYGSVLDSQQITHELNNGNYNLMVDNADRTLRKNAMQKYHATLGNFINTFSSLYISNIKQANFVRSVKHFPSTLEMSIFYEESSLNVYKSLLEIVEKNIKLLWEYFALKKQTLGLQKFANYDIYAPIDASSSFNLDFEESIILIKKALFPLGKEYVYFLQKAVDERWFDVYPNENKKSGAYSWGAYRVRPKILLNHNQNFTDVSTIAHEFGHSMHTYLSNKSQPFTVAAYTTFCAEVASIVNEVLLLKYLINNSSSKQEKIYLLNNFFINFYSTIYRQSYFSEFEEKAHAQYQTTKILSKDFLNNLYMGLLKKYLGNDVEILPEMQFEWSRVAHFFESFYVYKYATGMISALIIANGLTSDNEELRTKTLEGYRKFLKSGSSLTPLATLKLVGVDLEDPNVMQSAFNLAERFLEEWKSLLN